MKSIVSLSVGSVMAIAVFFAFGVYLASAQIDFRSIDTRGAKTDTKDNTRDFASERARELEEKKEALKQEQEGQRKAFEAKREEHRAQTDSFRTDVRERIDTFRESDKTEGGRASFQENLEERRNAFRVAQEEKRDELKAELEAKRSERRAQLEALQGERQAALEERVRGRINALADRLLDRLVAAVERLETLGDRVESRIEKFAERGADTTEAENFLAQAEEKLIEAETAIADVAILVEELLLSENPRETYTQLRAELREVTNIIREAHRLLISAVSSLRAAQASIDQTEQEDENNDEVDNE
ncbi:MAG: hypothetical protein WDZ90_01875 [Candidatus Paceibacterota bacterium]